MEYLLLALAVCSFFWCITSGFHPYILLMCVLLIMFSAMSHWRSYAYLSDEEHEDIVAPYIPLWLVFFGGVTVLFIVAMTKYANYTGVLDFLFK